jgi:Na+/H+-dicarboxylate symporter
VRRCAAKVVFECGDSWCVGDIADAGARGVPGSAIVILAATLCAVPAIPAIGLVLVLSVDWFVGIARAVGNLTGNCVASVESRRLDDQGRDKHGRRALESIYNSKGCICAN